MNDGRLCSVGDIVKAVQLAGPMAQKENWDKPVYNYPMTAMTTDMVVFKNVGRRLYVLLIKRGGEPFKGMFALPGGYVNLDETCIDAAVRELKEETELIVPLNEVNEVGLFDGVNRNPLGRVYGMAYWCMAPEGVAVAGDDAAEIKWVDVEEVLGGWTRLAFDHRDIINRAYKKYNKQDYIRSVQEIFNA